MGVKLRLVEKTYIRFGKIPKNEKSRIHLGDDIRFEIGVSVWDAVKLEDGYHLVAPLQGNSCTYTDFIKMAFPQEWYGDFVSHEPIYVVSGEEVGRGSDNEPLLKNIEIIEELPFDYFNYGPSYEKYMPKEKC